MIQPMKSRSNFRRMGLVFFSLVPAALVLVLGLFAAADPQSRAATAPNVLTAGEKAAGWVLLFDGQSFAGWRGLGYDRVPDKHWIIEDGAIKKVPSKDVPLQADGQPLVGGDLMTIDSFLDFELAFEWRISPGGNSGIKYNVSEEMSVGQTANRAALGFEYQVLDDDLHPDAKNGPNRTAAALYDLIGPANKILNPVSEYNTAKIVFHDRHGEHWLNGVKVLQYDLGTPDFAARLARSKYHPIRGFADKRKGHIVLQDHTDAAWIRNIKIRVLR